MNTLDKYLKNNGTNRFQVSKKANITPSTLQRAAISPRGVDGITVYVLKAIALALNKPIGTVLEELIKESENDYNEGNK